MSCRPLSLALLLVLAACGAPPPLPPPPKAPPSVPWPAPLAQAARDTPDAPFRERVPQAGPRVVFAPPAIESFALKNGIKVLFVARHDLPVASVRIVGRRGAGDLPAERPGLLAFMGAMLEQGTDTRTALAISDGYDALGAQHLAGVDWDGGQVTAKVLASKLDGALDLLADIAEHPAFPDAEIERLRARWIAAVQAERTTPTAMASNAVAAALYGRGSPYGHAVGGQVEDAKAITRPEIARAYADVFAPAAVTIAVCGDVTRDVLATKLEAAFGAWKAPPPARKPPRPRGEGPTAARLVLVDRPGTPQSQIVAAEVGVPFATPDRDAVLVMNAILGGMFSSHINLNLREAHAYTYNAHSRFSLRHGEGPFTAGGAVAIDHTEAAIAELLREIAAMREHDVSEDELADAKESIALALPGSFETVADVTSALAELAVYDLPLDDYAKRPARIAAITAADVKRAAVAHLHPAKLKVVVVGDRAKVSPTLGPLGLGDPELRDAWGDRVK